ncbi:hypothetical protein IWW54_004718, partial [Coemansia sp. RSA 2705]
MVLLARQDAVLSRQDSKAATLVTLDLPGGAARTAGLKMASFDPGHVSAKHASRADGRRAVNDGGSSKNSSSFEDAPFIVSGPLLPIRQHRRGTNPNRNYRVIGTQSVSATDVRGYRKQPEFVTTPPTPVSALVPNSTSTSTAGSSASQTSNACETAPGHDSGSSRSSKSTITSVPMARSAAFASPPDAQVARGGRMREYDKYAYDVQELPMEPIVLSGHNSAASLISSHRMSRSYGQLHAVEPEGRSATVRVSSLLPGARTSPAISTRRLQAPHASPPGPAAVADASMVTQRYLVQRVGARTSVERESPTADAAMHAASQIRIASPQIRLHSQRRSPGAQGLDTLEEQSPQVHAAVAHGDTPAYFADTEMDRRSSAVAASTDDAVASATPPASAERRDGAHNAARQSWNLPSDEDAGVRANDRQRKRRGMRGSITTEKFYVRPVSVLEAASSARPLSASADSPVDVPYAPDSPVLAALSVKSLHAELAGDFYPGSSADEQPPPADRVRFPSSTQQNGHRRTSRASRASRRSAGVPGLDHHRATSFDLGQIGPSTAGGYYVDEKSAPGVLRRSALSRSSASPLRDRTRSSDRVAALSRAQSAQTEKVEEGYDGDSEGLVSRSARIPVHRRNTVAGDKIDDSPLLDHRSARLRMPRNTSDFTDLASGKDERRAMRGPRRRSTTQSLLPIGTLIAP